MRERVEQIRDGLTIFLKYDKPSCDAQHDILYAGCKGEVSADDRAALLGLGWHEDDELECWALFT